MAWDLHILLLCGGLFSLLKYIYVDERPKLTIIQYNTNPITPDRVPGPIDDQVRQYNPLLL